MFLLRPMSTKLIPLHHYRHLPMATKLVPLLHKNQHLPNLLWKIPLSTPTFIITRSYSEPSSPSKIEVANQLNNIAIEYFFGSKEKKLNANKSYAIEIWKKARSMGSPLAAYHLAILKLEDNQNTDLLLDDNVEPIGTIQNLAEMGLTQAMTDLGKYYLYGNHGLNKDLDKATTLFERAAINGDPQASHYLYQLYTIKGEHENALKWLKMAADKGDHAAKFNLATMYNLGGPFIEQNVERATQLYKEAADQNNIRAAHNFAVACLTGRGIEVSPSLALQYFRIASDAGYMPSKMNLADLYAEGIGVAKDIETSKILYREVIVDKTEEFASVRENAKEFLLELNKRK